MKIAGIVCERFEIVTAVKKSEEFFGLQRHVDLEVAIVRDAAFLSTLCRNPAYGSFESVLEKTYQQVNGSCIM